MKHLNLTFETPEENLACDEALLDLCESGKLHDEILRFWEPKEHFVVVGYANQAAKEVNLNTCEKNHIPIFRRSSGGGTVLQGPGCLNYALILKINGTKSLKSITETNRYVLERHQKALESSLGEKIEIQGLSDLTIKTLKFSGNAQRRKKNFLLFHGTFLLAMDIKLIDKFLPLPSKHPEYRGNRPHSKFLTNLESSSENIQAALRKEWKANEEFNEVPSEPIQSLARDRFLSEKWNLKF